MSGIMGMKRCGTCFFARLSPQIMAQDLTKRICWGAPPSAIQLRNQQGQMTLQMTRPVVSVSEDACALHRLKEAEDVARDDADMRTIQEMKHAQSETKQ